MVNNVELAWLGGLFDGEGSLTTTINEDERALFGFTLEINLSISNSDKEVIERARKVWESSQRNRLLFTT